MSSSDDVLRWIAYFWIALLAYVFVGGTIAQGLGFAGAIGPYCADTIRDQEIYPACVPCGLNWSVFGVIELTPCGNPVLEALINYGVLWPHVIVVILAIVAYPVAGALRSVEPWLAGAVLLPIVAAVWIRTIYFNFFQKPNIRRGVHRTLLVGCILLATLMASSI
jgi:hypothetical protein